LHTKKSLRRWKEKENTLNTTTTKNPEKNTHAFKNKVYFLSWKHTICNGERTVFFKKK
jgi:hypothetical protein